MDEEGEEATALRSGREVIVDEHGLVTLCPDLGYYDGPSGARRGGMYGAASAYPDAKDRIVPSMQARQSFFSMCVVLFRRRSLVCILPHDGTIWSRTSVALVSLVFV